MSDKKAARFIKGDRIETIMDVNADELDVLLERLAIQLEEAYKKFEAEEAANAAMPGFINDCRKR